MGLMYAYSYGAHWTTAAKLVATAATAKTDKETFSHLRECRDPRSSRATATAESAMSAGTMKSRCRMPSYNTPPVATIPTGTNTDWTESGTRASGLVHGRRSSTTQRTPMPPTTATIVSSGSCAPSHAGTYHHGRFVLSTSFPAVRIVPTQAIGWSALAVSRSQRG